MTCEIRQRLSQANCQWHDVPDPRQDDRNEPIVTSRDCSTISSSLSADRSRRLESIDVMQQSNIEVQACVDNGMPALQFKTARAQAHAANGQIDESRDDVIKPTQTKNGSGGSIEHRLHRVVQIKLKLHLFDLL
jgi:hypothetical protein